MAEYKWRRVYSNLTKLDAGKKADKLGQWYGSKVKLRKDLNGRYEVWVKGYSTSSTKTPLTKP